MSICSFWTVTLKSSFKVLYNQTLFFSIPKHGPKWSWSLFSIEAMTSVTLLFLVWCASFISLLTFKCYPVHQDKVSLPNFPQLIIFSECFSHCILLKDTECNSMILIISINARLYGSAYRNHYLYVFFSFCGLRHYSVTIKRACG